MFKSLSTTGNEGASSPVENVNEEAGPSQEPTLPIQIVDPDLLYGNK